MKTLSTSLGTPTWYKLIASLFIAVALLLTHAVSTQIVSFTDQQPLPIQGTDDFKVAVIPVYNSLLLRVVFENPKREKITLQVQNSKGELVYTKEIGRTALYNSKFDLSQIKDGTYTMVTQSKNQRYAHSFLIATQQERMARAL